MKFTSRFGLLVLFGCSLFSYAATAQTFRPSAVEPGQVQQRLQLEDQRPAVGGESVITLPDENGNQKPLNNDVTFTLKGIVLENKTVMSDEELRANFAEYIGKDVTLNTLNQIAGRITAQYRNAGYILSRAVIPPQKIDNGIVKIRIVEGHISKVTIEGTEDKSGIITAYATKLRDAKPLDTATLERYLLLMEDLPGISAHAVIRPSAAEAGASDLVITIAQKSVDGSATADNRGTRYMGPVQLTSTTNINNALGLYDRTQIRGAITPDVSELKYGQISHDEQLDDEGTRLTLSASHTATHPGYKIHDLKVTGEDTLYSALVSHPFIRSRQDNLFGNVQFDVRNTNSTDVFEKLYQDYERVVRVGGSFDFVDQLLAVNRFETQISKGFNWDTGNEGQPHSRATATPNFVKATGTVSRLQPIDGPFGVYVQGTGQWSANTLLSAEQFSLGGPSFGSAYDPSEIVGDSGIAGRVELQFSQADSAADFTNYQLYGFYDIGMEWTRAIGAGQKSSESLASAGGGIRFNLLDPVSGSFEVAVPLTRAVAANGQDGNSTRFFFALAYRY